MLVLPRGKGESVPTLSNVSQIDVHNSLTLCASEMNTTLKMKKSGGLMYFLKTSHR